MLRPVVSRSACFATMTALHGTGKLTDRPFVIISQSSAALVPRIRFSHTTQLRLSHTYSPGAALGGGVPHVRGSSLLHLVLYARVTEAPRHRSEAFSFITVTESGSGQPVEELQAPQKTQPFSLSRIGPACRGVTSPPKNTTLLSRADRASLSRSYERPVRPGPSS